MTGCARVFWIALCVALATLFCAFGPEAAHQPPADFIVTAAPVYEPLAALRGAERFPQGAQLLLVHGGKAEPLVTGFAATADANVSFDAKTVFFAGKKSTSDPWQIWELTLADRSVRRVVTTDTDAERPLELPGGRVVYAQRTPRGFQLVSADDGHMPGFRPLNPTTGPGPQPLTYFAGSAFPADVLADGRILFESGYPLGSSDAPELYLVYADGSGVESYRCDHGEPRWGGHQLASGDVVFTHGDSLARFTSPLAHEERIAAPMAQYAGAVAEMATGAWLLSARPAASGKYVISQWKPGMTALQPVLAESGENLVDAVFIVPRTRPNRHPSGLHPWNYANLLALDARLSRDGALAGAPARVRLEAQDAQGRAVVLGSASVEQDGSFFVKVPADRAIRFVVQGAKGEVLRQEHGWFWARGGEQRICVGCHTGPERAAENRVPAVLLRTTEPVDLTAASDKQRNGGN
jgi:hypothetical protein